MPCAVALSSSIKSTRIFNYLPARQRRSTLLTSSRRKPVGHLADKLI
jgi:hypothetical protein